MKRLATYSQHFLRSPRLVRELVGHSNLTKHDTVYDIGAGSGVISSVLADKVELVVAIEYEPRTADTLRANMAKFGNVQVRQGDIMQLPLPTGPYKIFANIPFHLSSPIVRRFTEAANPPDAIYLIVQKQFAQKIVPSDRHFTGQLGAIIGPLYTARIRRRLERTDFWPHPNVDTVLLELIRRPEPLVTATDMPAYREFIAGCFSTPKIFAATPRASVGISLERKPSELTIEQWASLFQAHKAAPAAPTHSTPTPHATRKRPVQHRARRTPSSAPRRPRRTP